MLGSSGFLGRVVTERLRKSRRVVPTHKTRRVFPDSLPYDIFSPGRSPLFSPEITTVVICADFESEAASAVEDALRRLLEQAQGKRVVYLSSDAIFSGERGLYSEDDVPEPRTPYGRNLLACETLVRERGADHLIIRPSYCYGFSHGQLDPRLARTRSALRAGETVSLFEDMYKSPLGVQQLAEAVASLNTSSLTGILHVAGPRMSVLEFHRAGMVALRQDSRKLVGTAMPESADVQRDTSLSASRWRALSGSGGLSVAETLRHET